MKIKGIEISGHYIMLCKYCDAVISQCKCFDLNKQKIYAICDECEKKETVKELKEEIDGGEKLLVEHFRKMNGSFYTAFFTAALNADEINLTRLEMGFPLEIKAVRRYKTENGYWENLQSRYDRSLK